MYFSSINITYIALVFFIVLMIVYFFKRKESGTNNRYFLALLIVTSIIIILEMINPLTMQFRDNVKVLNDVISNLYFVFLSLWGILFVLYIDNAVFGDKHLSKERKITFLSIAGVIVFIISCVIIFISDVEYVGGTKGLPYVATGVGLYYIYIMYLAGMIAILFLLNMYRDRVSNVNILPIIIVFVSYIIMMLLEIFYNFEVNELALLCTIDMVCCYLTIESQDFKLLEMYNKSKKDAEKANEAKTIFLMKMSHEIRTPMNIITGYSQALLEDNNLSEEKIISDIKNVKEASVTLTELIDNILTMSNIENKEMQVIESKYFLENLIFEINSIIPPKLKSEETKFRIDVDPTLPKEYLGDAYKLYKINEYLLLNAVDCTGYGEVKLDIRGEKKNDNEITLIFTISNSGHVMSNDSFNKSFDDFINISSKSEFNNTRLGVIIAKELVKLIGGNVEFINERGQGTKYIIKLDQKVTENTPIGNIFENIDLNHNDEFIDLTGKNILVVDDGEINLKMSEKSLKEFNANVVTAKSGKECVELVKTNNFDLIFLDQYMPEMDGIATIKALISTGYKIPPIVALTANTYDSLKNEYSIYGFSDYLHKPIILKDLNRILKKIFKAEDK